MARMAYALVAFLALAAFPAPTAQAAPFDLDLNLTGGLNWMAVEVNPPTSCIKYRLYANFSAGKEAWVAPMWFSTGGGSFGFEMPWAEPGEDRVKVVSTLGNTFIGQEPRWDLGGRFTFPASGQPDREFCSAVLLKKVAFAVPHNTNARLRLDFSNPLTAAIATYSGSDAFLHTAQDFSGGTIVEHERWLPPSQGPPALDPFEETVPIGAHAAEGRTVSQTLPAGLLGAFVLTSFTALYSVDGPGTATDQGWNCSGGVIGADQWCQPTSGSTTYVHIGNGRATNAPAGSYQFTIQNSRSATDSLHAVVVGAPVNW